MLIRAYLPWDCEAMWSLFYQTVHAVNAKDYSQEQLNAWAADAMDLSDWYQTFSEHITVVAIENGTLLGFGDIDKTGYLDRLYVHKDYQRQGIATVICDRLEQAVEGDQIITDASITARPFFLHRGYRVIKEQEVIRKGIVLKNYKMEKTRCSFT